MKIEELKPRQIVDSIKFKVLELGEERITANGNRVLEARVGDETGTVKFTLWNEDIGILRVGETYELKNGYATLYRGSIRLTRGRNGELKELDEDIPNINLSNDVSERKYQEINRFGMGKRGIYGRYSRRR